MYKFLIFFILIFNKSFSQVDSLKNNFLCKTDISVGGSIHTGGLKLFTLGSSLKMDIDYNKLNAYTYLRHSFNKSLDNVLLNDFFGFEMISIGKERRFHPKFAGLYEKSTVKSIDNYFAIGVGLGWHIVTKNTYKLELTNSLLFERKEFVRNKGLNYEGVRYSILLKGKFALFKNKLLIKHKFFINPFIFNQNNNYRHRLLIDLILPISIKLSFKSSFEYSNESIFDDGLNQINSSTIFGLLLNL